jgi:hypothetical protein
MVCQNNTRRLEMKKVCKLLSKEMKVMITQKMHYDKLKSEIMERVIDKR